MQVKPAYSHHAKGLLAALHALSARGIKAEDCLRGTGLSSEKLLREDAGISREQEFTVYRNIQLLCDEPLIGLELGAAYQLETYGILGYAMLSAQTLGEALTIAAEYSDLTYSHFRINQIIEGNLSGMAFEPQYEVPEDLLRFYCDRDLVAALVPFQAVSLDSNVALKHVRCMHDSDSFRSRYEETFACDIEFGHWRNELLFDSAVLSLNLPTRDQTTSQFCREQCDRLQMRLSRRGRLVQQVRQAILFKPGVFPDINQVAHTLGYSVRTLRRHLQQEGSSYQGILNEIRLELAQEYLRTGMPIARIADLLGYTEPANFSHAFKRLSGQSPRFFREQLRQVN